MWDFESESKTESHSESQSCFNLEFLCSKAPTVYNMKEVFFNGVKKKLGNTELINLTVIDVDKISVVQTRNISNML